MVLVAFGAWLVLAVVLVLPAARIVVRTARAARRGEIVRMAEWERDR